MKSLLAVLSGWLAISVCAGGLAGAPPYQIRSWGPGDGLPEEMISSIEQTSDGYLWLATADGAIRFDGHDFDVFRPPYLEPGSAVRIEGTALDTDQSLIAGVVDRGLFRLRNGEFSLIDSRVKITTPVLLARDSNGGPPVFVSNDQVYRVRRQGLELWRTPRRDRRPYCLAAFGRKWLLGYPDGEILVIGDAAEPVQSFQVPGVPRALLATPEGDIWVGAEQGLARYRTVHGVITLVQHLGRGRSVSELLRDNSGRVWVGLAGGLAYVEDDQLVDDTLLPKQTVGALFEDAERGVWVSYSNGRLFRLSPPRFRSWGDGEGVPGRLLGLDATDPANVWMAAERGVARWKDGVVQRIPGPWETAPPRLVVRDQRGGVLVLI